MIGQLTVITTSVNNHPYHLLCNPNSSFGDLKEALFQLSKLVAQQEDIARERAQKEEEEKESKDKVEDVQYQ